MPQPACGSQGTTFWNWFSPSIFAWIPSIKLRSSSWKAKCSQSLNHLLGSRLPSNTREGIWRILRSYPFLKRSLSLSLTNVQSYRESEDIAIHNRSLTFCLKKTQQIIIALLTLQFSVHQQVSVKFLSQNIFMTKKQRWPSCSSKGKHFYLFPFKESKGSPGTQRYSDGRKGTAMGKDGLLE